jgi:hypothetical protein
VDIGFWKLNSMGLSGTLRIGRSFKSKGFYCSNYKSKLEISMDEFSVPTKEAAVLEQSDVVEQMKAETSDMSSFPVLIDNRVNTFHELDGGWLSSGEHHIISLTIEADTMPVKPEITNSTNYEIHLDDVWHLDVVETYELEDDETYTLYLSVVDHVTYPHSFSEAMSAPVDGRETSFDPDGE